MRLMAGRLLMTSSMPMGRRRKSEFRSPKLETMFLTEATAVLSEGRISSFAGSFPLECE